MIPILLGLVVGLVVLFLAYPWEQRPPHPAARGIFVDTPEIRTAVHEAGHGVAAWMCTIVNDVSRMTIEFKENGQEGGRVFYNSRSSGTPDGLWCHLVISLAGIAAEISAFGRTRSKPSEHDLLKSREIAAQLIAQKHLSPPWSVPDRGRTLRFERMYTPPLSYSETIVLKRAYHMAHEVLSTHENAYGRLVSMLLAKKHVNEADVTTILGRRGFTRASGVFRSTFIMPKRKTK